MVSSVKQPPQSVESESFGNDDWKRFLDSNEFAKKVIATQSESPFFSVYLQQAISAVSRNPKAIARLSLWGTKVVDVLQSLEKNQTLSIEEDKWNEIVRKESESAHPTLRFQTVLNPTSIGPAKVLVDSINRKIYISLYQAWPGDFEKYIEQVKVSLTRAADLRGKIESSYDVSVVLGLPQFLFDVLEHRASKIPALQEGQYHSVERALIDLMQHVDKSGAKLFFLGVNHFDQPGLKESGEPLLFDGGVPYMRDWPLMHLPDLNQYGVDRSELIERFVNPARELIGKIWMDSPMDVREVIPTHPDNLGFKSVHRRDLDRVVYYLLKRMGSVFLLPAQPNKKEKTAQHIIHMMRDETQRAFLKDFLELYWNDNYIRMIPHVFNTFDALMQQYPDALKSVNLYRILGDYYRRSDCSENNCAFASLVFLLDRASQGAVIGSVPSDNIYGNHFFIGDDFFYVSSLYKSVDQIRTERMDSIFSRAEEKQARSHRSSLVIVVRKNDGMGVTQELKRHLQRRLDRSKLSQVLVTSAHSQNHLGPVIKHPEANFISLKPGFGRQLHRMGNFFKKIMKFGR